MNKHGKALLSAPLSLALALGCVVATASAEISDKDFSSSMEKFLATEDGVAKVGDALDRYFRKKQQDAMKQQEDQQKAEVENQFKSPANVEVGSAPIKGPASAKVTIIEFSDFECPYCKRGSDTLDAVMKAYPNDVKVAFKHYPLPFHAQAMPASKAAWAAQQQGKFWEFYHELFENQDKLGDQFFADTAKKLGLNVDKFKTDSTSDAAEKAVKADMELGQKNGIQGTPGFFVNGVAVKGAYPVEHFKMIIDRHLGKKTT